MSSAKTKDNPEEPIPVSLVAYEDGADLEIDYSGESPTVENHDDLVNAGQTYLEVRGMRRADVDEWDLDVVEPGDPLWSDVLEEIEVGETFREEDLRDGSDSQREG